MCIPARVQITINWIAIKHMTLPYDVERCKGKNALLCQRCMRREPGDQVAQWFITPALTLDGCQNFIGYSFLNAKTIEGGLVSGSTNS